MRCAAPGCPRPVVIKKHQLCWAHARRYYRTGSIGTAPIQAKKRSRNLRPFLETLARG